VLCIYAVQVSGGFAHGNITTSSSGGVSPHSNSSTSTTTHMIHSPIHFHGTPHSNSNNNNYHQHHAANATNTAGIAHATSGSSSSGNTAATANANAAASLRESPTASSAAAASAAAATHSNTTAPVAAMTAGGMRSSLTRGTSLNTSGVGMISINSINSSSSPLASGCAFEINVVGGARRYWSTTTRYIQ
jgi:hypothetical protein